MATRYFALILGIVYVIIGILGFVPGFLQPPPAGAPDLTVDAGYGYLLGLFPVNVVHDIVHLLVGLWGLIAYRSFGASRLFARGVAILFGLLTVLGLFPVFNTLFGLVPLFSNDIWLHALTAIVAAYFGWMAREEAAYAGPTPRS